MVSQDDDGRRRKTEGRLADGNGLYLFVQPTGTRSWVQRIVIRERRRQLGLGAVPLAKARELALAAYLADTHRPV